MKNWRLNFIFTVFGLVYFYLIYSLYDLQLAQSSFFIKKAAQQNLSTDVLKPARGNIYITDKNNAKIPVAFNKEFSAIVASPAEIENPAQAAKLLAPPLGLKEEDLLGKLSKKGGDQYELLLPKAGKEIISAVKELNLKGIRFENKRQRFYPFGDLASHVLGFVAPANDKEFAGHQYEESGQYGVEAQFEKKLGGRAGELEGGKIVSFPQDGEDIYLSLDRDIQKQSEEVLEKLIKGKEAVGGSVIVENPRTGKILALAAYPNFDPNDYASAEMKSYINPAVQSLYEPGSVFKLFTMSAGLDSGKIRPETKYTDTGSATLNGRTIKNWDNKAHGVQTMANVIEHSLNTGTIFAERQTGHDLFKSYLLKFGLGSKTGIELPGEINGSLKPLESGRDINFATASFGQGVAFTPIRLIASFSALANKGIIMAPSILADEPPKEIGRAVSEQTAKEITAMMVTAVKTNVLASIPKYSVAGKTGTAFVPNFKSGGYTDDVINSYVGFTPASDPKFIILIKLDKPYGAPLSGQTVVPAFKELAQFILNYYNVAPDEL